MVRLAMLWTMAMLMTETAGIQLTVGDVARSAAQAAEATSVGGAPGNDRYDIALLAAHTDGFVNMTSAALAALGWESGLTVNFNSNEDQALTFYKNGTCLITFSAVNDATDTSQMIGGAFYPPVTLCGHDVHSGVAQELQGFMSDPGFGGVVDFMNHARCTEAVVAGASLGGAIASLYGACASRSEPGFGNRTGYRLVTFGSPPFTTTPLSNGAHPSGLFEGTRYAISESDGGANKYTGLRGDFRTFALDSLQVLSDFAAAKNMTAEAAQVLAVRTTLNSTAEAGVKPYWESTQPSLLPLWLALIAEVMQNPTSAPSQLVIGWMGPRIPSGIFSFEYDAIPVTFIALGFRHPLVDFQPIPNPLIAGGAPMDMVPAGPAVADLPRGEFVQASFGNIAGAGWFPNHNMCCYADMGLEECQQAYEMGPDGTPWRICSNAMLHYLPPADDGSDQSSVIGDPHVINVAQVKFEIRAEGVHKLVQIPQLTHSSAKPDLRVDAEIRHLASHDCGASYMTSLTIFGRWAEDAFGLLRISPGSDKPNTTLLVNTKGPEEFFKQFPSFGGKARREFLMLKLRDVEFHVGKHVAGRYGKQRAYLDVRIKGLKKHKDIGGLLGYDSHEDAEKPSADCAAARPPAANGSSLIGGGRSAPATDGGSWIQAE